MDSLNLSRINKYVNTNSIFYLVIIVAITISVIIRLLVIYDAHHPGHADLSFYYEVATNIVDGNGLKINYVWNYYNGLQDIPTSSTSYWHPLTAILISIPMFIFGKSVSIALLASISFSIILFVIAYMTCYHLSNSNSLALGVATLVFLLEPVVNASLVTDSEIFYAVFIAGIILCLLKAHEKTPYYGLAAILAGMAYLTRSDGIIAFTAILVVIVLSTTINIRQKMTILGLTFIIFVVTISPLIIYNYNISGQFLNSKTTQLIFIEVYENIYSFNIKQLDDFLAYPLSEIIKMRLDGINTFIFYYAEQINLFIILIPSGIYFLIKNKRLSEIKPILVLILGYFIAYGILIPWVGSLGSVQRTQLGILPFLISLSLTGLYYFIKEGILLNITILTLLIISMSKLPRYGDKVDYNNGWANDTQQIQTMIDEAEATKPITDLVIMTRIPWQLNVSIDAKYVMIPYDNYNTIIDVAKYYDVDYLLWQDDLDRPELMSQLTDDNSDWILVSESEDKTMQLWEFISQ